MNTTHHPTVSPVDDAPMADSIQEIIVFVDGETEPTGILEFAGVLAQEYGAHLTAYSCGRRLRLPRRRCSPAARASRT